MSNRRRPSHITRPRQRSGTAAIYVDELGTPDERRQELVNILRSKKLRNDTHQEYLIYGIPSSDVDERLRDAISILTEHGIKITFKQ